MGALSRVMAACVLFCIVEFWYWTGVLLFAFERGGTTVAALVLLAQLVPAGLLAAPLGAWAERLPRGTALSGAYALQAAGLALLTGTIALGLPLPAVVAVSAAVTVVVSVARPIHHASLPTLAPTPGALVRANAGTGVAEGVGVFVGPVLAGVLAQTLGYAVIPALCAVAMAVAALLTIRLRLPRHSDADDAGEGWTSGVRAVSRDRSTLTLLLVVGCFSVVIGSLELIDVSFATEVLAGGETLSGLLIGAAGIGLFLGSLAAAFVAIRRQLAPVIVSAILLGGIPLAFLLVTGSPPPAIAWLTLSGIGLALASVAARTLLQRTNDGAVLGRIFAVQEALMMLGLAAGAVIGPIAIAVAGPAGAYVVLGIGLSAIALLALPALRGLDRRAVYEPDILAALRAVPFLTLLSPPDLARLVRNATWIDVPAQTVVIEQGDHGDAFYAIHSGELAVVKDGERLPYDLGAGEGFGELALLRDARRAATIRALTDCRLVRVERDDFLAAVTGSADGHAVARDVAAAYEARVRNSQT